MSRRLASPVVCLLVALAACSESRDPVSGGAPAKVPEAQGSEAPRSQVVEKTAEEVVLHENAIPEGEPEPKAKPAAAAEFAYDTWNTTIGLGGGAGGKLGRRAEGESSTESYAAVPESGFFVTRAERLSTFGVDVDTASWSNVRRFLRDGALPPADAVRIEELVNAFSYGDPGPAGRAPFGISTELGTCPWNTDHWLLRVALRTRAIETERVPPCNLVFLLDVSGSMNRRRKLPLLKRAFGLLTEQLRPQDRVAIVTYASGTKVALETATGAEKQKITDALNNLKAGGSTAGAGGIQKAYEIARAHLVREGVNRVILATDGDFNVGISDVAELKRFIEQRRDDGVFLSVLGFGTGNLKDDKLEALANQGNGAYAYIDTLAEARRVLVEQFGASMMTVAKDVKVQVEFNVDHVAGYRLLGYENRRLQAKEFRDDKKDAGEIGAGHAVSALFEIVPKGLSVPGEEPTAAAAAAVPAAYGGDATDLLTVRVRYKPPLGDTASELAHPMAVPAMAAAGASDDFALAAAVAAFGMRLRASEHLANFDWDGILELAKAARGDQPERQELVQLIERARALTDPPPAPAGDDAPPRRGGDGSDR